MEDSRAINEYAIKLHGKAFIPEKLKIGENYHVDIEGTITETTESDNDDGSHLFTHKFKPILVKVIDDKGKAIKARDVRSKGQQLRSSLWKSWKNSNEPVEFDNFYEAKMNHIIGRIIEGEL
jgi:hypothetical protein